MTEEQKKSQDELSLGQLFKAKREFLKIETHEICSTLNIKTRDIEAVENDDTSNLSTHLYIPGLIRSYAKFLKIDPKIIEERIKSLSLKSNTDNKKHLLINIGEHLEITPDRNMFFNMVVVSILFFLVLLSLYNSLENKSDLITNKDIILELENSNL
jgi:cytoskeletal protein RodZ